MIGTDLLRDLELHREAFENEVLLHGYSSILNRYAISETFARKHIWCNKLSWADAMIRIYGIDEATKLYNTLSIRAFMDIMLSHWLKWSPKTLSDAFSQGEKKIAIHPKKYRENDRKYRENEREKIDKRNANKKKDMIDKQENRIPLNTVLWDRTEKPVHYEWKLQERWWPMKWILFNHPY